MQHEGPRTQDDARFLVQTRSQRPQTTKADSDLEGVVRSRRTRTVCVRTRVSLPRTRLNHVQNPTEFENGRVSLENSKSRLEPRRKGPNSDSVVCSGIALDTHIVRSTHRWAFLGGSLQPNSNPKGIFNGAVLIAIRSAPTRSRSASRARTRRSARSTPRTRPARTLCSVCVPKTNGLSAATLRQLQRPKYLQTTSKRRCRSLRFDTPLGNT